MALRYVTIAEIQAFVGDTAAGNVAMLTMMGEAAESYFDGLIGSSSGLIKSNKTEIHRPEDYADGWLAGYVFDLRTYNIDTTVVPTINGTGIGVLNTDWVIDRRTITLKTQAAWPTVFPYYWSIVYSSGYAAIGDIPSDVKIAVLFLVKGKWLARQALWIESFKQDLLSVNYSKNDEALIAPEDQEVFKTTVGKYMVPYVLTT